MKILKEHDVSHHGNDCYVYERWILVEIWGETKVILADKVSGWSDEPLSFQVMNHDMELPEEISDWYEELN